jgi:hypothetical protein
MSFLSEAEFIQLLQAVSETGECSLAMSALADRGILAFPKSARLCYLRGKLMPMTPDETTSAEDAIHCFQKAVDLDPYCADAHEQLADYFDGYKEDPKRAERHYKVAHWLRSKSAG